jgi:hypothetical protein
MSEFVERGSPLTEKELTTYISTDLEKLFLESFFSGQRQTAGIPESRQQIDAMREVRKYLPARSTRGYSYDQTIVRFYEDIISELQRELARYKDIVQKLLFIREIEAEEIVYSPGEPTVLPPELAQKLRGRTKPGSPMVGYEI